MHFLTAVPLTVLDTTDVHKPPCIPQPPEYVATYAEYLKGKYKQMPLLPVWDWPPSTGRQYTQLSLIERDERLPTPAETKEMENYFIHGEINEIMKMRKEQLIEIADLFSPGTSTHRPIKLLMDGTPGTGKTTITRKICKDWACGKLLQHYHLVILLDLRNQKISGAKSIEDLFPTDNPEVKHQVIHYIQKTYGEHTLFIFDGYDELNDKNKPLASIFLDIIQGEALHNCSVLVTSRPYASDFLQESNCIDRHVEVIGFTKEQIQSCIRQTIPHLEKSEGLIKVLEENLEIMSLCYTPLYCTIMLYVYKQDKFTLPNTLTKLFNIFVLNALKWNAGKQNDHKVLKRLHTLDKLPDPLTTQFESLCKLAFDSFLKNKVVFSYEDLKFAFPDCSNETELESNLFGLITASKSFTSSGGEVNYHFLHLSIQEFLVAKWATITLSDEKQAIFIKDHLKYTQYRNVLKFLAGISRLKGVISDLVFPKPKNLSILPSSSDFWFQRRHLCESFTDRYEQAVASHSVPITEYVDVTEGRSVSHHIPMRKYVDVSEPRSFSHRFPTREYIVTEKKLRNKYKSSVIVHKFILLTQLIYESQNFTILPRLLHLFDNQEISFSFHRLLPSECIPLAHFLARAEYRWKVLSFHFCALTDHSLEILQKVSLEHGRGAQCEKVHLSYNGSSLISKLSLLPKISLFNDTKFVIIEGLQYPDGVPGKQIELYQILEMKCLTDLRISVHSIPVHHLTDYLHIFSQFIDALKSNKTLNRLSYEHPHNSGCSVFECTAAALKQNSSLHLSSQFKIQKGYPCELSTAIQGWKVCKTVAFHLFQLPCMKLLKEVDFQQEILSRTCDNQTCCSNSRENILQAFESFLVATVSEVDLHSDVSSHAAYRSSTEFYHCSIRDLFDNGSDMTFRCTVNMVKSSTCFHVTSLITKLSLLPRIALFNTTTILSIHNLKYSVGVPAKQIELQKVLDMRCLTDLRISVQSVACQQLTNYIAMFTKFMNALKSNENLLRLLYEHPRSSNCSVFECTAAALNQNTSLHLNNQFKIQKGYPCELSMTVQGFKMCKTVAFHLFQLPCIKHVMHVNVQHKTFLKTCYNQTCCSFSREKVLQAFEDFLVATVSKIDLFHSDISSHVEYNTESTKNYSIGELIGDGSVSTLRCTEDAVKSSTNFHVTSLITKLPLLLRISLLNSTTTVSIHDLKYPEGVPTKRIELHRILDMRCLTDLRISVQSVPGHHHADYLSTFTEFTNALKNNENLERLLYEHPHNSNCSVFECTAAALKQNTSLHLNNQFKIQKGYPCELSMTVQDFKMCKTVAFYLFQLPCIKHVKQVNVQYKAFYITCDNQTCCSFSRGAFQTFKNFLVEKVSKIDLLHSDISSHTEYSSEVTNYSIRSDGSDSTFNCTCTVNAVKSSTNFQVISLITKLSLLPRIALFNNTTTVSIHDLKYPEGAQTRQIELYRILDMRCLTDLRVSVLSVPENHRDDYLSMFTQFTRVLRSSKTIEKLLYEHPHTSDCSVFKCTATVLKQNTLLHLNSRYMIQMGYPCRLSENVFHWGVQHNDTNPQIQQPHGVVNMCSTIAFHFFQVPCINHVKKFDIQNSMFKSCYFCSTLKNSVIQALKTFLKISNTVLELNLSHCGLTDQDAELIAAGLAENKSVKHMNISGNEFSAVAMLMLLKSNSTISHSICAHASELTAEACTSLIKTLNQSTSMKVRLSLMNNSWSVSSSLTSSAVVDIFTSLQHNTNLEELNLSRNGQLTEDDTEAVGSALERMLSVNRGLQILKLQQCRICNQIGRKIGVGLASNKSLRVLNISHDSIHSDGAVSIFTSLEHNTSLEELDLSRNKQLIKGDSEAVGCALQRMLIANAGISVLKLNLCGICDNIAEKIGIGLAKNKSVRVLNVSMNYICSGGAVSIFRALEHNTSLEELDLSRNEHLTEGDVAAVGCTIERMLAVNTGIHTLNLQQCGICDQIGKQMGVGLTGNKSLRVLNISHGSIHSGGAVSIFTSLEHNSSLEEFDLSWNWYLTKDDSEAVGCAIERMLTVNKGIQTLKLQQCGICDRIGNKIGVGLVANKCLRVLNISHGNIHSGSGVSIFTSLEANTSLEELDLSWNWFLTEGDSEGVGCALERMLTVNTGMQTLKLAHCRISDHIGKKIGMGLAGNKSLKLLNISWNSIHSDGAMCIFRSLEHNTNMEELDLSQNEQLINDSEAVGCALERMLTINRGILTLKLHQCGNIDIVGKKIRVGLAGNQSLRASDVDSEAALHYMQEKEPTTEQQMTMRWRTCTDTAHRMRRTAAVSHDKMAYFINRGSREVHEYDSEEEQWRRLTDCPYYNSSLVIVKGHLTTIGGSYGGQPTNSLVSLTEEGEDRKWVEHFPQMLTSRYDLAAVCSGKTLIAAGGFCGGRRLNTVEIMDTESLQWTSVSSLPHPMEEASITVCDDKLYLLGGCNRDGRRTLSVFTCSIHDLLQAQPLDVWNQAADTPYYFSTAASVGNVLLAIGGLSAAGGYTSSIVVYDPTSDSWQDMGHMTTPRSLPLVAALPSNEIIVVGGCGGQTKVEIGRIILTH